VESLLRLDREFAAHFKKGTFVWFHGHLGRMCDHPADEKRLVEEVCELKLFRHGFSSESWSRQGRVLRLNLLACPHLRVVL